MTRSLMAAAALLFLAACSSDPSSGLDAERERWANQGVTSYEIVISRVCECLETGPVRVTVANGVVASRVFVAGGQPVPAAEASLFPDVPGLFDFVEDAYQRAASVNVSFHGQYGFPIQVVVDYVREAIDDEITLVATGFVVLP